MAQEDTQDCRIRISAQRIGILFTTSWRAPQRARHHFPTGGWPIQGLPIKAHHILAKSILLFQSEGEDIRG